MALLGGTRSNSQNSGRLPSLVRGFCALVLGWPGQLKGDPAHVILNANRSSQLVMACAVPESTDGGDSALGNALLKVAFQDLANSGAVTPLLESAFQVPGPSSHLAMRKAGASLLLRTTLKRSWNGKLIVKAGVTDLGTDSTVFRKGYSCVERNVARTVHRMVDDLIGALTGVPGVANSRIVFVHELANGRKDLFQVDPDGGNLTRITAHESLTISPSVAGDGKMAYVTYVAGMPHVWGQRHRGGGFECLYPPDPARLAMAFTPAWSPNGRRLAMVLPNSKGDSDISTLNMDTSKLRRLTGNTGINTEPAWNPAGSQIAFTSDRDGSPQLYLMETDGSNQRRLTLEGLYNASPAWSPDGGMIAYVSRMDGRFNLFVYKIAEGRAYQITRGSVSSESPSWSPDGRWIAYASDQDGKRQLFVTDLSGTTQRRVLDLPGCQSPFWTRTR